jgi:hypothetical protein
MADSTLAPRFVSSPVPPTERLDRYRAIALGAGSVAIAFVGGAWAAQMIAILPSAQFELVCEEPYAGWNLIPAYDHAMWSIGVAVWLAFAALAVATFSRSRSWVAVACCSAGGLFAIGTLVVLAQALTMWCQG